jgi:superfamily II DNA or RNA helicase
VATSGGKTLIIATLVNTVLDYISGKVFILVPDLGLVEQTFKDFVDYGVDPALITKWTGENPRNPDARIIIANMGILQSKNTNLNFLKDVDFFIMDECHKLRHGNEINSIVDKLKTINRVGFTGTLPEETEHKWNVFSKLGPVIFERTTNDLRQINQYIASCKALAFILDYTVKPDYKKERDVMKRYALEVDFIINSE